MENNDTEDLIEFLKARRKSLHHTKDQVKFDKRIPNKQEANIVLRGRMNEIGRMIRKLSTVGLRAMTAKEKKSLYLTMEKKKQEQRKAGVRP